MEAPFSCAYDIKYTLIEARMMRANDQNIQIAKNKKTTLECYRDKCYDMVKDNRKEGSEPASQFSFDRKLS